jgi:hypothetical protein
MPDVDDDLDRLLERALHRSRALRTRRRVVTITTITCLVVIVVAALATTGLLRRGGSDDGAGVLVGSSPCAGVQSDGTDCATEPPTSAETRVQLNFAAVAVAQDHAVVADGSIPTVFSIADLESDRPTELRRLKTPMEMMVGSITAIGEQIVVIGGACGEGVTDDGIEQQCRPGTPVVESFQPRTGEWKRVRFGLDDAFLVGALVKPLDDGHSATVELFLRTPEAPEGEQRLFALDTTSGSLQPQALPPDFTANDGPVSECFGSDGSEALAQTSTSENVPGAQPSRVWWRASAMQKWTTVSLPDAGDHAWRPQDCIEGNLLVVAPAGPATDGATDPRLQQFLFDRTTMAWRRLPTVAISATGQLAGAHHGPGPSRRWKQGQLWAFDVDTGGYRNTGVPSEPLGYVRWSVPWGTDRLVALVDARGRAFDKYVPMQLSLAIVDLGESTAARNPP